jgi:hypothetical protein
VRRVLPNGALLAIGALLVASVALAADVRVAVVAAPPASDGVGRVSVIAADDAIRKTIAEAPTTALRAEIGAGSAKVTAARPAAEQGGVTLLAFDQSGSFKAHWADAFRLAGAYADALGTDPTHRVGVLTFGVSLLDHGVAAGSADVKALLSTAESKGAVQGYTRLRNFIRESSTLAETLLPLSKGGLREVIVFTDAGEESTAYSVDEVVAHARQLGVRVNVVVLYTASQTAARRLDEVKQIAERTGGRFVQVDAIDQARPLVAEIASAPSRTFWVELSYCGVPSDRGERFDDTVEVEVWQAGARLGTSGVVPFRQHAATAALSACASAAPADVTVDPPAPAGWSALWRWAVPLGLLLLALLLLLLWRARRAPPAVPAPVAPSVAAPIAPPPAPLPPPPMLAAAFEPTDEPWQNPLERLPAIDLELVTGPPGARARFRLTRRTTTVGARPEADLRLDVAQISNEHAVVHLFPNGNVFVQDERSTNGTFVDGQKVDPGVRKQVKPGQTLSFSRKVVYRVVRAEREHAAPAMPAPPPAAPAAPAAHEKARTIIAPVRPPKDKP